MNNLRVRLTASWNALRNGDSSQLLAKYSGIIVALGLVGIIASVFIPPPPILISLLISFNIALSLGVLLVSLYIASPLQLTSYPAILLLTTVLRLFLSLSVTRSIIADGYAGTVIEAIGHTTVRGDLIVGFVMFAMLVIVQFIVITKGAERVAEVGARFTLDAMPGKQMSIDADMRAGLLSQDEARIARAALQKESQLYGAMDGAMKFVKGDAIATIAIAFVNIVAGLTTGVLVKQMSVYTAAHKYTILTIGDALAAIIPSVFIALSAGIVVTRVSAEDDGDSSVGADISRQLFANPQPIAIAGGLILALSLFLLVSGSGFVWPLMVVGIGFSAFAYSLYRGRARTAAAAEAATLTATADGTGAAEDLQPTFSVPLMIVVNKALTPLIDPQTQAGARFRAELPKLRTSLYYDLGVLLPDVHVSGDAPIEAPHQYFIALREVPVAYGALKPDHVFVNDSAEHIRIFGLNGQNVRNPADLRPGAWIPKEQREIAEMAGLKVWEPGQVILLHLSNVLKRHIGDFIGIQEAQAYLDFAARGAPKLVEEVVPKLISIHQFTDVLQRLVQEGISIRDTKMVLDTLSEWARVEKDAVMLTEYVRASMKRYISYRFARGRDTLFVYILDPEIEDVMRSAIRRTTTGAFLSLDPMIAQEIQAAVRHQFSSVPPGAQTPVIITDVELRRFVRKMVELEFPNLSVLSYQELAPDLNVQPIGRISMRPAQVEPQEQTALPAAETLSGQTAAQAGASLA